MDRTLTDTIDMHGDPLAFKFKQGARSPLSRGGRAVIKVEARQMAGHSKEAVVTEGTEGTAWRLATDEGLHLKGTDLAPFPLGYFNAGLQGDLYGRIRTLAEARGIALDGVEIKAVNHYWLTGSFINGTGEGHNDPTDIDIYVKSSASTDTIKTLVAAAADASPVIAFLRTPVIDNTFALYVNGRRREVQGVANSPGGDASDPYRTYASMPRPFDAKGRRDLVEKTNQHEVGTSVLAGPAVTTNRLIRDVCGEGRSIGNGLYETHTWLNLPGNAHYKITSDESGEAAAPSGLALASAGISFCYMTQLARYIENMKMNIRAVRLVQYNPYIAGAHAVAEPIDTHLFLNGDAPEETHLQLLTIAARTCYLHAAAKTPNEPKLRIVHNGAEVAKAA
jgi:hypothetical protein